MTARKHSTRKWEKKPPAQNRQKPCFRCDKTLHSADECHYKDAQCRYCHKDGHIMSNCFAKQKAEKGKRNRTHQLTAPIQDCVPSENTGATSRSDRYPNTSRWEDASGGSRYRCHSLDHQRRNVAQTLAKLGTA